MTWLPNNFGLVWELTLAHLWLAIPPIVLGFVISIPLGWLAYRFKLTRGLLLTVAGLLYTIPSLALFVILPPLLGISFLSSLNLTIALTLYAIALMARSIADALASVDPAVRSSATAVGYGSWRRFWGVEFPLAGPVILAGLRVTAVSTISLVPVGILIGVQSLGYLFTNGYQRGIVEEILVGVVMVVALALLVDGLLILIGRMLMPWAPRRARRTRALQGVGA
ncbi:osmoprotectant transport system permease protein [Microbacteriaceae bacterium SG_E_30_P1]|uniref:Osmoprotectant transport system permease protein n=1 Tax=Antiquaquibacter oligotrophicus TaxID=2880260 RepID=A0ABT6KPT7_9MICO|nr:ABC transporter permease [Antiquaquibacter oligotrophicus]MDH6181172.1 osmoprotectant transport system permease protein [Antiquaquibacter oligotrophicus]UDF13133.1 ABC transporter permease [Antiquaquibacter oligotrophicus]